jgi:hypothetical protein
MSWIAPIPADPRGLSDGMLAGGTVELDGGASAGICPVSLAAAMVSPGASFDPEHAGAPKEAASRRIIVRARFMKSKFSVTKGIPETGHGVLRQALL